MARTGAPNPAPAPEKRRGRPRSAPQVECPEGRHRGARVVANGTYTGPDGALRRKYRCTPRGHDAHSFTVIVGEASRPLPPPSAAPECPTHGTDCTITRYGRSGHQGEATKRQRYKCVPNTQEAKAAYARGLHVFTPKLAREHVHFGAVHCDECGEPTGLHRGSPVASRTTTWALPVVAEGLARLSAGESYGKVGQWAWEKTGRDRTRPAKLSDAERERRRKLAEWKGQQPRRKRGQAAPVPPAELAEPAPGAEDYQRRRRLDANGNPLPARRNPSPSAARSRSRWQTAADWVSSYSGALWLPLHERLHAEERAEHARRAGLTPEQRNTDGRPQILMLDDVPVVTKHRSDGYGARRFRRTYFVLAAGTIDWSTPTKPATRSWEAEGRPEPRTRLRLLRGFATNEAESWKLLFHELGYTPGEYEPEFIVADAGTGLRKAVEEFFTTAVLVPSLWHAQNALEQVLTKQSGPNAVVLTDLGMALHPRLTDVLADLTADSLRTMDRDAWDSWWNDLETAATDLDLDTDALAERRAKYQQAFAEVLDVLAANPGVPVSSGGFETVLRGRVTAFIDGRSHALANIERCAALFDLCVCRDHGMFHNLSNVADALRVDVEKAGGWAPAARIIADPQPPYPNTYSSLRDRNLPIALAADGGAR